MDATLEEIKVEYELFRIDYFESELERYAELEEDEL